MRGLSLGRSLVCQASSRSAKRGPDGAARPGAARGNRRQRRVEGERQAEQRAVVVEAPRRLVGSEESRDALESLQQRYQRRLHPQQHGRAALGQRPGVAAELDRVAEALLGVDENDSLGRRAAPCRATAAR